MLFRSCICIHFFQHEGPLCTKLASLAQKEPSEPMN